jgi:hypothetical protein
MPKTRVILYCEEDGSSLFLEWIEQLPVKAQDKCLVRVERLGIHYRILYFFHGAAAAIVSQGM